MKLQEIKTLVQQALPDAQIEVSDMTGGGDHIEMRIISSAFSNKTVIEQHRMVYDALGTAMNGPIHALKLHTEVPEGVKN